MFIIFIKKQGHWSKELFHRPRFFRHLKDLNCKNQSWERINILFFLNLSNIRNNLTKTFMIWLLGYEFFFHRVGLCKKFVT